MSKRFAPAEVLFLMLYVIVGAFLGGAVFGIEWSKDEIQSIAKRCPAELAP